MSIVKYQCSRAPDLPKTPQVIFNQHNASDKTTLNIITAYPIYLTFILTVLLYFTATSICKLVRNKVTSQLFHLGQNGCGCKLCIFFFGIVHNHLVEWHETTKFVIALLLYTVYMEQKQRDDSVIIKNFPIQLQIYEDFLCVYTLYTYFTVYFSLSIEIMDHNTYCKLITFNIICRYFLFGVPQTKHKKQINSLTTFFIAAAIII